MAQHGAFDVFRHPQHPPRTAAQVGSRCIGIHKLEHIFVDHVDFEGSVRAVDPHHALDVHAFAAEQTVGDRRNLNRIAGDRVLHVARQVGSKKQTQTAIDRWSVQPMVLDRHLQRVKVANIRRQAVERHRQRTLGNLQHVSAWRREDERDERFERRQGERMTYQVVVARVPVGRQDGVLGNREHVALRIEQRQFGVHELERIRIREAVRPQLVIEVHVDFEQTQRVGRGDFERIEIVGSVAASLDRNMRQESRRVDRRIRVVADIRIVTSRPEFLLEIMSQSQCVVGFVLLDIRRIASTVVQYGGEAVSQVGSSRIGRVPERTGERQAECVFNAGRYLALAVAKERSSLRARVESIQVAQRIDRQQRVDERTALGEPGAASQSRKRAAVPVLDGNVERIRISKISPIAGQQLVFHRLVLGHQYVVLALVKDDFKERVGSVDAAKSAGQRAKVVVEIDNPSAIVQQNQFGIKATRVAVVAEIDVENRAVAVVLDAELVVVVRRRAGGVEAVDLVGQRTGHVQQTVGSLQDADRPGQSLVTRFQRQSGRREIVDKHARHAIVAVDGVVVEAGHVHVAVGGERETLRAAQATQSGGDEVVDKHARRVAVAKNLVGRRTGHVQQAVGAEFDLPGFVESAGTGRHELADEGPRRAVVPHNVVVVQVGHVQFGNSVVGGVRSEGDAGRRVESQVDERPQRGSRDAVVNQHFVRAAAGDVQIELAVAGSVRSEGQAVWFVQTAAAVGDEDRVERLGLGNEPQDTVGSTAGNIQFSIGTDHHLSRIVQPTGTRRHERIDEGRADAGILVQQHFVVERTGDEQPRAAVDKDQVLGTVQTAAVGRHVFVEVSDDGQSQHGIRARTAGVERAVRTESETQAGTLKPWVNENIGGDRGSGTGAKRGWILDNRVAAATVDEQDVTRSERQSLRLAQARQIRTDIDAAI